MIPTKILEVGAMLGLNDKDIRDLESNWGKSDKPNALATSPLDNYKDGQYYGTISIRDFK